MWAWHPPVGGWIAVLGLLGIIVPLIRDVAKMNRPEKAIWTAVMFALLLLELKTVYQDRREHDKEQSNARDEQLRRFAEIARGIRDNLEAGEREFKATTEQNQRQFSATMNKAEGLRRTTSHIEQAQTEESVQIARLYQSVARAKENNPSSQVLLKLTSEVTNELRMFPYAWQARVQEVELWREELFMYHQPPLQGKEKTEAEKFLKDKGDEQNKANRQDAMRLLRSADSLVSLMQEKIPAEQRITEDNKMTQQIRDLMQDVWHWKDYGCCVNDIPQLADYVDQLAKRTVSFE